jgi:hypothetical protein
MVDTGNGATLWSCEREYSLQSVIMDLMVNTGNGTTVGRMCPSYIFLFGKNKKIAFLIAPSLGIQEIGLFRGDYYHNS